MTLAAPAPAALAPAAPARQVEAGLRGIVRENLRWTALIAGVTFLAFALMHVTPLGSGLASQIGGNLVAGAGLVALVVYLRRSKREVQAPNALLAGAFLWILAGDAFLTYTEHSVVSLNVALFVILVSSALLLSTPALLVVLAAANAEGLFVSSLVPDSHVATQATLQAAACALGLTIHAGRLRMHRRLEALRIEEAERRVALERAVEEVRRSEEHSRHLADAAFEGLVVHEGGRIADCNGAFATLAGAAPEALRGRHVLDLVAPEHQALVQARIGTWMEQPFEAELLRADGARVPVEIRERSIVRDGREARVMAVRDLTSRRLAERATREQGVARRIVRRALHPGTAADPQLLLARRRLGRDLAAEAQADDVAGALQAFDAMGLGRLKLKGADGQRFTFEGQDLLDLDPTTRMPSCMLALGYVEGVVSQLTGKPTLGAELECQSQGRRACVFVAMPRAVAATAAVSPGAEQSVK